MDRRMRQREKGGKHEEIYSVLHRCVLRVTDALLLLKYQLGNYLTAFHVCFSIARDSYNIRTLLCARPKAGGVGKVQSSGISGQHGLECNKTYVVTEPLQVQCP